MTSRIEPTNATLLKEIKAIRDEQQQMNTRLSALENKELIRDAAQAAVEKYKAEQESEEQRRLSTKETRTKTEVYKQVAWILGILGAILATYATTKGIV